MEEKLDLVFDFILFIFKKHANVNYLTLKFEHIIKDQVSYNHECLTSYMALWIMKKLEDILSLFKENIGESIEEITNCDDDVCFNPKIDVWAK